MLNRYFNKIMFTLFILLFSSTCYAVDWFHVFDKYYIDADSIYVNPNTRRIWYTDKRLRINPKEKVNNKDYWYTIWKCSIDCENLMYTDLHASVYGLDNKLIASQIIPEEWYTIQPMTMPRMYYVILCGMPIEQNPLLNGTYKEYSREIFLPKENKNYSKTIGSILQKWFNDNINSSTL